MKRLGLVAGVLVVALIASLVLRSAVTEHEDPVVVVHWANSHPMREGLLPEMAEKFNDEDHETADGRPIKIVVVKCESSDQVADLGDRVGGEPADEQCRDDSGDAAPDPTIITPQSDDWLVDVNNAAPEDAVELDAQSIAQTWLGIVTYRDMAACLGWPQTQVGYAEVIKVLEEGWDAYPDCRTQADWGDPPNLVFTNPNTSTSGRNVLVSLFTMFADKTTPADLRLPHIQNAEVLEEVASFQELVDHYMPTTSAVNAKIEKGPLYGSFFLMPEDNLANLVLGNEEAVAPDGSKHTVTAPEDLVMIYPKEGAVLNSNPAALVDAGWVSDREEDAADVWIGYLLEDDQQRAFMDMGFRPAEGSDLTVDPEAFHEWGLNAAAPQTTIDPGQLKPEVLQAILEKWGTVKKPAIVTFVVDLSGSMDPTPGSDHDDDPINQVKKGLIDLLNAMAGPDSASPDTRVAVVTFKGARDGDEDGDPDDQVPVVEILIEPQTLETGLPAMGGKVDEMSALGQTPLYDAVRQAVEITHAAEGEDGATRAVVVLSDGEDNLGGTCLDELVTMESIEEETAIETFCGKADEQQTVAKPVDVNGEPVDVKDVRGTGAKLADDVQIFFLGFKEADIDVGRILADATGGEYHESNEDLATVIQALSGYF